MRVLSCAFANVFFFLTTLRCLLATDVFFFFETNKIKSAMSGEEWSKPDPLEISCIVFDTVSGFDVKKTLHIDRGFIDGSERKTSMPV